MKDLETVQNLWGTRAGIIDRLGEDFNFERKKRGEEIFLQRIKRFTQNPALPRYPVNFDRLCIEKRLKTNVFYRNCSYQHWK